MVFLFMMIFIVRKQYSYSLMITTNCKMILPQFFYLDLLHNLSYVN